MPVIGHALVGLATAIQCEPRSRRDGRPLSPAAVALWIPAVVAVSYVPDVITQAGAIIGLERAGLIGHSLLVGIVAGAVAAGLAARASGLSLPWLMCVSIGTILGHDVLDILQATDRAPWPWSTQTPHVGIQLLPQRLLQRACCSCCCSRRSRYGGSVGTILGALAGGRRQASTASPALPALPLGLAWSRVARSWPSCWRQWPLHAIRGRRERRANLAGQLLRQGRYAEALARRRRRGPLAARGKPGRIDLIRGEPTRRSVNRRSRSAFFLRA